MSISTKEFVLLLWSRFCQEPQCTPEEKDRLNQPAELLRFGKQEKWLEEQDILTADEKLERRHAARIIHEFIRIKLKETDEQDWEAAKRLKDLYDCRTCVNHVAQVYQKGIMGGLKDRNVTVFGMRDGLDREQALLIAERTLVKQKRLAVNAEGAARLKALQITYGQALELLQQDTSFLILDLRDRNQYDEHHLPGARNITMTAVLENHNELLGNTSQPVLLYCEQGYRSEIVANCLVEAGYEKVYSFALRIDS